MEWILAKEREPRAGASSGERPGESQGGPEQSHPRELPQLLTSESCTVLLVLCFEIRVYLEIDMYVTDVLFLVFPKGSY